MSNPLRLFVALDLPDDVRRQTAAWGWEVARSAQGLRAVPAANTHITLAFLGDRPAIEIESIGAAMAEAVARAGAEPVELSLGAPLRLPRRRPRALAFEIHDDGGRLLDLQAAVAASLATTIGWKAERSFRPHLTAVRLSRSARIEDAEMPVTPAAGFPAESISLQQSRLTQEGAEYETLTAISLDSV